MPDKKESKKEVARILIITLGTQASGSTWLYNVVLSLFEAAQRPVFGASADDGMSALDQMPLDVKNVVLKSHGMDQRLLKFARVAGARLLVSVRDPRDSIVSQRERFDLSLQQASMEISRALATIGSLPADIPVLRFNYEEGFTRTPETIAQIARFLGIPTDYQVIEAIFDSLSPQRVQSRIAARFAARSEDEDLAHDPITQWHFGHVGDGKIGKWRDRLDEPSQVVVNASLNAMVPELQQGTQLRWSPELFTYNDWALGGPTIKLSSLGAADFASWGPYLCLPKGRWRAVALVSSRKFSGPIIDADIFLPWEDLPLAESRTLIMGPGASGVVLDFDHYDYFQPVEARLRTVEGSRGSFIFSGWQLHWMGPLA